jgi:hypothetical protein
VRFSGHGAASGVPIELEAAHLYTLRDGTAAKLEEYGDRAEAMKAAGRSEGGGPRSRGALGSVSMSAAATRS